MAKERNNGTMDEKRQKLIVVRTDLPRDSDLPPRIEKAKQSLESLLPFADKTFMNLLEERTELKATDASMEEYANNCLFLGGYIRACHAAIEHVLNACKPGGIRVRQFSADLCKDNSVDRSRSCAYQYATMRWHENKGWKIDAGELEETETIAEFDLGPRPEERTTASLKELVPIVEKGLTDLLEELNATVDRIEAFGQVDEDWNTIRYTKKPTKFFVIGVDEEGQPFFAPPDVASHVERLADNRTALNECVEMCRKIIEHVLSACGRDKISVQKLFIDFGDRKIEWEQEFGWEIKSTADAGKA